MKITEELSLSKMGHFDDLEVTGIPVSQNSGTMNTGALAVNYHQLGLSEP